LKPEDGFIPDTQRNGYMNSRFQVALVAGALLAAGPVLAAGHTGTHKHHGMAPAQKSAGDMTTDQLNAKSLAEAQASMTPAAAPAAPAMSAPVAAGTGMTAPAPAAAPSTTDANAPQ